MLGIQRLSSLNRPLEHQPGDVYLFFPAQTAPGSLELLERAAGNREHDILATYRKKVKLGTIPRRQESGSTKFNGANLPIKPHGLEPLKP